MHVTVFMPLQFDNVSEALCLQAVCPLCLFICLDRSCYHDIMKGLINCDETDREYSLASTDELVSFCFSGQAHSSSQAASRLVQLFLYGSQMLCCTSIVNGEETLQNCPSLSGFCHHTGEGLTTAIGFLSFFIVSKYVMKFDEAP